MLRLYASKPLPRGKAGSIKYVAQNPSKISNAVEAKTAEAALDAAIEAKNLDAAVGIIEETYSTKAYRRSRVLRKALLPASAFTLAPFAIYGLATSLSSTQNTMDSGTATQIAFVGMLAYVGFTAAIGLVATTTANDHMKRISWIPRNTPGTEVDP